jgi:Nitronate monooxygenase
MLLLRRLDAPLSRRRRRRSRASYGLEVRPSISRIDGRAGLPFCLNGTRSAAQNRCREEMRMWPDTGGIAAAFALGAAGVQIGSAYLHCPESRISPMHRAALASSGDAGTALTNLMTGRPARGVVNRVMHELGPMGEAPEFPLRAKAEAAGSGDFSPMWSGQAAALGHAMPAGELTRALVAEAQAELQRLGGR